MAVKELNSWNGWIRLIVMKVSSKRYPALLFAISLSFITPLIVLSGYAQGDNNPTVYSKDSTPFGLPYKDWIAKWWQWNVGIPTSQHPRDHYTAEKCTVNQNGSVWYLPDILTGKEERYMHYT